MIIRSWNTKISLPVCILETENDIVKILIGFLLKTLFEILQFYVVTE